VTVSLTLHGREAHLTLRDTDEHRLLARLAAVLARVPAAAGPAAAPGEGYCPRHQVAMQARRNATGAWWSHRTPDGRWCRGTAAP
jgi:hypothetical protein